MDDIKAALTALNQLYQWLQGAIRMPPAIEYKIVEIRTTLERLSASSPTPDDVRGALDRLPQGEDIDAVALYIEQLVSRNDELQRCIVKQSAPDGDVGEAIEKIKRSSLGYISDAGRLLERHIARLMEELVQTGKEKAAIFEDCQRANEYKKEFERKFAAEHAAHEATKARFTAPVVCICGSTRFKQSWIWENARLTQEGNIVLAVGLWGHCKDGGGNPLGLELTEECKTALDALHKRKIDLCDWVWVLDVGGYIGESTRSEIAYAEAHGKLVWYLSREFPDYVEPEDPLQAERTRREQAERERNKLAQDMLDLMEADLIVIEASEVEQLRQWARGEE